MAALPYMQLYVADYLADTAHLNAAQHGAYLLLIMNYWQRGKPLKHCNERLANVARMSNDEWDKNCDVLKEFFEVTDEEWIHHRIERDLEAVQAKSTKASAAGRASAERRLSKRTTNVKQTFNHTDTDTDTEVKPKTYSASADAAAPVSASKKTLSVNDLIALNIDGQVAADFLIIRKAKKAPLTQTALDGIRAEAVKAAYTLEMALRECVARGWQGFKAEWVNNRSQDSPRRTASVNQLPTNYGKSGVL